MKRFLATAASMIAAFVWVAGAAGAGPSVARPVLALAASARAALIDSVCLRALDPAARAVSITAVMRPRSGTRRLSVRFELLSWSHADPTATRLHGGDLGTWISPPDRALGRQPADVWKIDKSVVDLTAPASYRFRVSFRWIGTGGRLLGSAVRYSPRCIQPELRPDVAVGSIRVQPIPSRPGRDAYIVRIDNRGATAAGPFEVLFAPADGSPAESRTVGRLGSHRTRAIVFIGPLCSAGGAPTITADPNDQLDDFDRSNNVLSATCPP